MSKRRAVSPLLDLADVELAQLIATAALLPVETRTHHRWMRILREVIRPQVKSRGGTLTCQPSPACGAILKSIFEAAPPFSDQRCAPG
jgi:hypothetical protein